jgi:hypothetical protein
MYNFFASCFSPCQKNPWTVIVNVGRVIGTVLFCFGSGENGPGICDGLIIIL